MVERGKAAALVALSLAYPIVIALAVATLAAHPAFADRSSGSALAAPATAVLAVIALLNIATPWQQRTRWQEGADGRRHPGLRVLIMGLPFAAAPASYGLLLFFLGGSLLGIYLFAAGSFAAAAAWGWWALRVRE